MNIHQTASLSLLIGALLLAGCGQTGALYLPESDPEPATAPVTAAPQEQEPPATGTGPTPGSE